MGIFAPFSNSIRLLKLGQDDMGAKRETRTLRGGDVIDVRENFDGNYGAPGVPRLKKSKPTKEQMVQVNLRNKANLCRLRMLAYMNYGDYFGTWTYKKSERPPDMNTALKHFRDAMRKIRPFYAKSQYECFWFRNIEQGTKGAWHIHFVIKNIPGAAEVIKKAWKHGGTYIVEIRQSELFDEDFTQLANYMTKNENTIEYKEDGTPAKPRLKTANYWTSKNMPLPEPKKDKLVRWKKEVKPKKGYYIINLYEGKNPITGLPYRHYTMIRIRGDDEDVRSEYIFGNLA